MLAIRAKNIQAHKKALENRRKLHLTAEKRFEELTAEDKEVLLKKMAIRMGLVKDDRHE